MIPRRIAGATRYLGAPVGWIPEKDGDCGHLAIRIHGDPQHGRGWCESAWEPTPKELEQLKAGGSIVLRIIGWQPPVAIYVEPPGMSEPAGAIVGMPIEDVSTVQNEAHEAEMAENAKIPVDRSQRTLTDGSSVTPDHRELKENGQQKGYVVLSAEERAKGFVRPVRDTYRHLTCGSNTTMGRSIAETYARDPGFYSGTFCVGCGQHFPLDQFVWDDGTRVGS